jgi:single-strand DNA-binding protein
MSYLNQVMLIGNLGNAPEVLKEDQKGCFVRLSIATTHKYKNADGNEVQKPEWHKVFASNGQGKYAASYLKKGDKVLIVGELKSQKWTDKKTGEDKSSTAVYALRCQSLMPRPKGKEETAPKQNHNTVNADDFVDETCAEDEFPLDTQGKYAEA